MDPFDNHPRYSRGFFIGPRKELYELPCVYK